MTMLVTVDEAKQWIVLDHDLSDEQLELMIHGASAYVLRYIKDEAALIVDTSGALIADVPYELKMATLAMVSVLFANRGEDGGQSSGFADGYPPPAVRTWLHMLRIPTVA